jgi:hypothetical protein
MLTIVDAQHVAADFDAGMWLYYAGANYRSVWALHKHFPNVKIYVRAHDVQHGLNLEKARHQMLL